MPKINTLTKYKKNSTIKSYNRIKNLFLYKRNYWLRKIIRKKIKWKILLRERFNAESLRKVTKNKLWLTPKYKVLDKYLLNRKRLHLYVPAARSSRTTWNRYPFLPFLGDELFDNGGTIPSQRKFVAEEQRNESSGGTSSILFSLKNVGKENTERSIQLEEGSDSFLPKSSRMWLRMQGKDFSMDALRFSLEEPRTLSLTGKKNASEESSSIPSGGEFFFQDPELQELRLEDLQGPSSHASPENSWRNLLEILENEYQELSENEQESIQKAFKIYIQEQNLVGLPAKEESPSEDFVAKNVPHGVDEKALWVKFNLEEWRKAELKKTIKSSLFHKYLLHAKQKTFLHSRRTERNIQNSLPSSTTDDLGGIKEESTNDLFQTSEAKMSFLSWKKTQKKLKNDINMLLQRKKKHVEVEKTKINKVFSRSSSRKLDSTKPFIRLASFCDSRKKPVFFIERNSFSRTNSKTIPRENDFALKTRDSKTTQKILDFSVQQQRKKPFGIILRKKKYNLMSSIWTLLYKFPRRKAVSLDSSTTNTRKTKYLTSIRFRLAKSRFIINRLLKAYYTNIKAKKFKKISSFAKAQRNSTQKYTIYEKTSSPNRFLKTKIDGKAKSFVMSLEERLDSSLYKILNFKQTIIKKKRAKWRKPKWHYYQRNNRKHRFTHIKPPYALYRQSYIKQLITHGHVFVNDKKITFPGKQLSVGDKIRINTFYQPIKPITEEQVSSLLFNISKFSDTSTKRNVYLQNHRQTLFLRRSKTNNYLKRFSNDIVFSSSTQNIVSNGSLQHSSSLQEISNAKQEKILNFIRNLKVKRYLELFYITYRNLHLIPRDSVSPLGVDSLEDSTNSSTLPVEHHLRPLFNRFAFNQSLFALWPTLPLLRVSSWGPKVRNNFIRRLKRNLPVNKRYSSRVSRSDISKYKKSLQHFIKWKRLQNPQGSSERLHPQMISEEIIRLLNVNPLFLYASSSRSYASMAYGTRKMKWVILQQGMKKSRYLHFYRRIQFFNTPYSFFHLVMQSYAGR